MWGKGSGSSGGAGSGGVTVVTLPWWCFGGPRLDMADRGDVACVLGCSLLATLAAQWLSHLLSRHALPFKAWRQAYGRLGRAKRDEWNTRVCSSLHALLVSG